MSKNGTLDDSQLQYFEQQKKNSSFSVQILSIFTFSRRKRAFFFTLSHHSRL